MPKSDSPRVKRPTREESASPYGLRRRVSDAVESVARGFEERMSKDDSPRSKEEKDAEKSPGSRARKLSKEILETGLIE